MSDGTMHSVGLIIDSRQRRNRFGRYAGEILSAEGITDFQVVELARVTLPELQRFGVVMLTSCGAVPGLDELLASYVESGGRLLLVQPALELASLVGLEPLYQARYAPGLLVDNLSPAFGGFPYDPLQVIGPLDLYRVQDRETAVVARGVAGQWPVESHPAIVARTVGQGRVLAFLYDLPHTVARLRQGDPTLSGSDTDGLSGVRPNDAMQWQIDPLVGHIPQAEVHQAMLARAVEWLCPWPLPRLWYLPGTAPSLLILTGDLCSNRPDESLVDEASLAEQHGGTLTFYLNEQATLDPQIAAGLEQRGHSLSIHPFAVPFSAPHMDTTLGRHLDRFAARFGSRPRTVRHHRLQWLGWAEQARIELRHGLEMDLNFTTARPLRNGYSFGAGRPIRFVDEAGEVIGCWQQPTQFEDDLILGDHEISLRIDTAEACALYDELLAAAISRWHTVVAVNLHPGNYARYSRDWGRHLVAATARQGVPIWNAARWLEFTRDRASLRVAAPVAVPLGAPVGAAASPARAVAWRIDVPSGTASADLTLLIPERFDGRALQAPDDGPTLEIYGWRYRGIALHGAPAALDVTYGGPAGSNGAVP